jgi:pimeloyl-ACP methyl ester carboxylesterase/DNA-binding winged helix-turn-helix (wHTH) protein
MRYLCDTFEIDSSAREIVSQGAPLRVEPKVFDLILHLVEARDRVVTKDELVAAVWQGRVVSDAAISTAVSAARRTLGDDGLEQRLLRTLHGRGFRFVGSVVEVGSGPMPSLGESEPHQEIRYCRSVDGTRIAYALAGHGPPLVEAANWIQPLELAWQSPVWRHYFTEFSTGHTLLRYDGRGMGLSDWRVSDLSPERQLEDLEAVVDEAGFQRFALIGISFGCSNSVMYAVRHPERVTKLVLLGGYVRGWKRRGDPDAAVVRSAAIDLIRVGWGRDNPAVRNLVTAIYMPDAPTENQQWFSDLQRRTTSPENAAGTIDQHGDVDVGYLLSQVRVPTLVIHARHDAGVPFEQGQELAAGIPGARFVALDSSNHILPASDPAWQRCARQIREFLAD